MNDEQVSESNQGDVLSASSDEDVLGDAGTFAALNTKVSSGGNSIKLENNYTYSSSTDSNYRNGIVINNDLEIDGQGHTIDGMSNSKTFNVSKLTTTIEINGSTIYVGQDEVFTITMSANITEGCNH